MTPNNPEPAAQSEPLRVYYCRSSDESGEAAMCEYEQVKQQLDAKDAEISELKAERDGYPLYSIRKIKELEAELSQAKAQIAELRRVLSRLWYKTGPIEMEAEVEPLLEDKARNAQSKDV